MTDQPLRKSAAESSIAAASLSAQDLRRKEGEDAERLLGRAVAVGLPVVSVVGAIVVGLVVSVGSGLLVLASGALLGTIALLWASVRTLSGDAPLPVDLETLAAQNRDIDVLGEKKRRVLRALKDLESEHAIGKLDDADYESLATQYREEAKTLMREMDHNVAPALVEAERLAAAYLSARGLGTATGREPSRQDAEPDDALSPKDSAPKRVACEGCHTSNEPDATFCKKCGAALKVAAATAANENDATS